MHLNQAGVFLISICIAIALFLGLPLLKTAIIDPEMVKEEITSVSQDQPVSVATQTKAESSIPETLPVLIQPAKPKITIGRVEDDYFNDALFVGDSLTYGLQAYKIITQASFVASIGVNLGTIGSPGTIEYADGSSFSMLEAIANQHNPSKVYVMMGTNGINWLSTETMIESYGHLLTYIRECFPDTIIYVQSILPAAYFVPERQPGLAPWKIEEYNRALQDLAEEKDAYFLDIHGLFVDEYGFLPMDIAANDGIHVGSSSYQRWYEYLKVNALIKE